MIQDQAKAIVSYLNACFPREALEPASFVVWVKDVELLPDALTGRKAAETIGRSSDSFPTIHQYRQTYRATAEAQRAARPALERQVAGARQMPTWVLVWKWARANGDERWFPQQVDTNPSRPVMTHIEYDQLEQHWLDAGRPVIRHSVLDRQS